MRSSIGKPESPMPTANVIVQSIVMAHMKVAAAVNAGRKRAAIKTSSGLSAEIASSKIQGWLGKKIMPAHKTAVTVSAKAPSTSSRRGGKSRIIDASPIASGAMVMVPGVSEANQ